MARQRSHSIAFKRQVAQEFIAGETLYGLSKRYDISRQLIRVWVQKYEAGAFDEDAQAADFLQWAKRDLGNSVKSICLLPPSLDDQFINKRCGRIGEVFGHCQQVPL